MNFSMATNHAWRDNEGNIHEETEWHTVVYWACGEDGSHAKFAPLMTKGTQVLVTGRIRTRVWDDRNGEKRQRKEIIANDVILTGNRAKKSDGTADGEPTDGSEAGRRTPTWSRRTRSPASRSTSSAGAPSPREDD